MPAEKINPTNTNTTFSARARHMVPSSLVVTDNMIARTLLQPRILRFGLLVDGDVGVGVFPEGEEIFVGGFRLGGIARHRIGATDLKMRECSDEFVYYNPTMVEDFLELGSGCAALMRSQIGFSSHKNGVQSGPTVNTGRRHS